jgi:hypothetical protein
VLTSSRDGAEVPVVAAAVRLIRAAWLGGWSAAQTYAHARLPDQFYLNGNLERPAHDLHTVAVRLKRPRAAGEGDEYAIAIWCCQSTATEPGAWPTEPAWRFRTAWFCGELVGARELTKRLGAP